MATWSDSYLIFNDSVVQKSVARREFLTRHLVARASQVDLQFSVRRYWTVDLSGLQLTEHQLEEIRALEAITHMTDPFLMRIASYCLLEDANNQAPLLGVGNGTPQTYPIFKRSSVQGRNVVDRIYWPNYDYLPLTDLNGQDWQPLPPLRVWAGSAPTVNLQTRQWIGNDVTGSCAIDRNQGTVTHSLSGPTWVTGGFLWKFKCPGGVPVTPEGPIYVVEGNVQMIEPFPDGGELLV